MKDGVENLMELFRDVIPKEQFDSDLELFHYGEGTIAMENLCNQIIDSEVEITFETFQRLKAFCEEYSVGDRYSGDLKARVKSGDLN